MSNFEYIIASLPYLTADYRYADGQGFGDVVAEIRENLSERDAAEMDFLLKGFDGDALDADFYAEALSKGNRFLREYFRFDLNLRNAKVRYLNRALGREPDRDVLTGEGKEEDRDLDIDGFRFRAGEFDEAAKVEAVLEGKDLLTRELQAPHRQPLARPRRGGRPPALQETRGRGPRHLQGREI